MMQSNIPFFIAPLLLQSCAAAGLICTAFYFPLGQPPRQSCFPATPRRPDRHPRRSKASSHSLVAMDASEAAPLAMPLLSGLPHHCRADTSLDAASMPVLSAWLMAYAGTYRRVPEKPPLDRITRSA